MILKLLAATGAAFLAIAATQAHAADVAFGRWLTDDKAAIVKIGECGSKLCGRIERVLDPKAPENDINNPDPKRRTKPLIGALILSNYQRSDEGWAEGRAYDPKSGNSYRSNLEVLDNGQLKVTGCVLFVCKSKYWTRAR
ncbi:MAG: DUF2147 domain-containing protein [Novosphingobium sp.]|nr:DUF2147 domain-containing protein [Novosphingobium sp.]